MLLESNNSPGIKTAHDKELRAGERVLQYLLAEFDRPQLKNGSRLPTNKELAQRLNVSLGTVQGVLRQLTREGRIRARRGSGTYLVSREKPPTASRIGVGFPLGKLQQPDNWISRLGGGMFHAALSAGAALEGVSGKDFNPDTIIEELMDKRSIFDALIVLPYTISSQHQYLLDTYEKEGKPVIWIYPPSLTATANFITTDFFGSSYQAGSALFASGRRRIVILTNDLRRNDIRFGISHHLRFMGFADGIGPEFWASGSLITLESLDKGNSEDSGYITVKDWIKKGWPVPDAMYCAGDWLAIGALKALREAGLNCPADISVIGASGLDLSLSDYPRLTRVRHEMERVGEAAIELALERILFQCRPLPGVVVPTSFIGGETTTEQENVLLGVAPAEN